jgi:hypothetical protein
MYFRLEVTVLPLPFFLIYMAAWPAQAAGVRFFYTEEGSVPACVLVFFYTEEVSAVRFFYTEEGSVPTFFYTETRSPSACRGRNRSNTAFPFSEETDVASPPALSPRRRVVLVGLGGGPTPSRRMRPAHRGDGRR